MRAFSLTELLVVLVLVCMSLGLVIARVHELVPGAEREEGVGIVLDTIALCRRQAVTDRDFYAVSFDLDMDRVLVAPAFPEDTDAPPAEFRLPPGVGLVEVRQGGRTTQTGVVSLVMTSTGVTTPFSVAVGGEPTCVIVVSNGFSEEIIRAGRIRP